MKAFHFGSPVRAPYFCDRDAETAAVVAAMRNAVHVFVIGPRRYGKSSVVLRAMAELRRRERRALVARVDLSSCVYSHQVATQVLTAVVGELGVARRAAHRVEEVVRSLRVQPVVRFRGDGTPEIAFDAEASERAWPEMFDDAVDLLVRASADRPVVLAVDEFQRIAEREMDPRWPGMFKAAADRLSNGSFVLCGSRRRVMDRLVRLRTAPLYGMGQVVALGEIPDDDMVRYLQGRAADSGGTMTAAAARAIVELGGPVPHYIQELAAATWWAADGSPVDAAAVDWGLAGWTDLRRSDYTDLFAELTQAQRRTLQLVAADPTEHTQSASFVRQSGVTSRGVVVALERLEDLGVLLRRGRLWQVADPFLRRWLVRPQG
jgi:hypothetical protein